MIDLRPDLRLVSHFELVKKFFSFSHFSVFLILVVLDFYNLTNWRFYIQSFQVNTSSYNYMVFFFLLNILKYFVEVSCHMNFSVEVSICHMNFLFEFLFLFLSKLLIMFFAHA